MGSLVSDLLKALAEQAVSKGTSDEMGVPSSANLNTPDNHRKPSKTVKAKGLGDRKVTRPTANVGQVRDTIDIGGNPAPVKKIAENSKFGSSAPGEMKKPKVAKESPAKTGSKGSQKDKASADVGTVKKERHGHDPKKPKVAKVSEEVSELENLLGRKLNLKEGNYPDDFKGGPYDNEAGDNEQAAAWERVDSLIDEIVGEVQNDHEPEAGTIDWNSKLQEIANGVQIRLDREGIDFIRDEEVLDAVRDFLQKHGLMGGPASDREVDETLGERMGGEMMTDDRSFLSAGYRRLGPGFYKRDDVSLIIDATRHPIRVFQRGAQNARPVFQHDDPRQVVMWVEQNQHKYEQAAANESRGFRVGPGGAVKIQPRTIAVGAKMKGVRPQATVQAKKAFDAKNKKVTKEGAFETSAATPGDDVRAFLDEINRRGYLTKFGVHDDTNPITIHFTISKPELVKSHCQQIIDRIWGYFKKAGDGNYRTISLHSEDTSVEMKIAKVRQPQMASVGESEGPKFKWANGDNQNETNTVRRPKVKAKEVDEGIGSSIKGAFDRYWNGDDREKYDADRARKIKKVKPNKNVKVTTTKHGSGA